MLYKKIFFRIFIFIPFILGVIGYLQQNPNEYLDALYSSIRLYGMETDVEQITPIIQIARWLAPLCTFTTIFIIARSLSDKIKNKFTIMYYDAIAIYGDSSAADYLFSDINKSLNNKKAIKSNNFIKTNTHVFISDDDRQNLVSFSENFDKFKEKDIVYLRLEDFDPHMLKCSNFELRIFSLTEITALLYWKENAKFIYDSCCNKDILKIFIIGDGVYAQKILYYALLLNIYSVNQKIEYHLFGNWQEYKNIHFNWDNIAIPNDKVIFYNNTWSDNIYNLLDSDKIIICNDDEQENLHITNAIYSFVPKAKIDLLLTDDRILNTNIMPDSISIFGAYNQSCTCNTVLQEELIEKAKKQHEAYKTANPNVNIADWDCLDSFTRKSNISSSIFEEVNLPLIRKSISSDNINNIVAELEHIRWCRYHFLYNWTYKEGGKDMINRTHNDLIKFKDLSDEEKRKDLYALNN